MVTATVTYAGQFVALSFESEIGIGRARTFYVDVRTGVRPDPARAVSGNEDRLHTSTAAFDVAASVAVHRATTIGRSPPTFAESAACAGTSSA